jgi:hypothetical protein
MFAWAMKFIFKPFKKDKIIQFLSFLTLYRYKNILLFFELTQFKHLFAYLIYFCKQKVYMKNSTTSRTIKLIMAFAIFYMVIGELITYHQKVIFGVDFFGNQHPYTKPKSGEDGSTTHFKTQKGGDKQDSGKTTFNAIISFELNLSQKLFYLEKRRTVFVQPIHKVFTLFMSLRAPPLSFF